MFRIMMTICENLAESICRLSLLNAGDYRLKDVVSSYTIINVLTVLHMSIRDDMYHGLTLTEW